MGSNRLILLRSGFKMMDMNVSDNGNNYCHFGAGLFAMISVSFDSKVSTVVATANCEETPNGDVEHCTLHDDGEQGGGAIVENHAGVQAGLGWHDVQGCSGDSGFHEGVPNNEPVGSGGNGLRNCD